MFLRFIYVIVWQSCYSKGQSLLIRMFRSFIFNVAIDGCEFILTLLYIFSSIFVPLPFIYFFLKWISHFILSQLFWLIVYTVIFLVASLEFSKCSLTYHNLLQKLANFYSKAPNHKYFRFHESPKLSVYIYIYLKCKKVFRLWALHKQDTGQILTVGHNFSSPCSIFEHHITSHST